MWDHDAGTVAAIQELHLVRGVFVRVGSVYWGLLIEVDDGYGRARVLPVQYHKMMKHLHKRRLRISLLYRTIKSTTAPQNSRRPGIQLPISM